MAPKTKNLKKNLKGSSSKSGKNKFVNEAAATRYQDQLAQKIPIRERGIEIDYGEILRVITTRKWETFVAPPKAAVVPLVKEFYANAKFHQDFKVFVREKKVAFGNYIINRFYELEDVLDDEYSQYKEDPDFDAIVQTLGLPNASWTMKDGRPLHIEGSQLNTDAKIWMHFVGAKLMPTVHMSDLSKDRAILIYCIMTGKSMDVGHIIQNQILDGIRKCSLPFPTLITELCVKAGVTFDLQSEDTQQPKSAMNNQYYDTGVHHHPAGRKPVPRKRRCPRPSTDASTSASSSTLEEKVDQLTNDVRQLQGEMVNWRADMSTWRTEDQQERATMLQLLTQMAASMGLQDAAANEEDPVDEEVNEGEGSTEELEQDEEEDD